MLTFYYLKERKEVKSLVSFFLPPPPPPALISKEQAFSLAILTFAKTRFCGHINLTGRCFYSKVFPNGFRSNFYSSSFFHFNQNRHQIQCDQNSLSRNIMIITIRAMCQKRNELTAQILHCRSELPKSANRFSTIDSCENSGFSTF